MLVRLKNHLSHHLIAYLALFIVLGGTAVALPGKGTVTSNDIAKKAVKSKNLAKKAVKGKNIAKQAVKGAKIATGAVTGGKIADGAVETAKIADNAVTGAKADEASFEGLVQGDGRLISGAFTVPAHNGVFIPGGFPVLFEIPGFGIVDMLTCNGDVAGAPNGTMRIRMLSSDGSADFLAVGGAWGQSLPGGPPTAVESDSSAGNLGGGGGSFITADGIAPTVGVAGHFEWQLSRGTGADTTGATIEVEVYNDSLDGELGTCHVTGQALIQE